MQDFVVRALVMGVFATAVLDLWALLLNRLFGFGLPNWALVGRWFAHLPRGRFVHADIAAAPGFANELAIGWIMHYAVGIAFAVATLLLAGPGFAKAPTPFWPLVVGWVTILCGWLILQPGMGGGIAASKRANRTQIRILNILGHTVFGLALWAAALALARG
ncbi:hypothetical protein ABB55_24160 [Prosthecomicrobium hirschii]|uniref:DUF2938 domain-containing protein n=1 Tax=Prosthecodimorpha hirschii TaxID=665126 RepID=A0A0P6WJI7_9HYPH|nr:DUF2938 family protein [Prosthecomicrobium hirschii]KPL54936.1 hypothetical protein ABB55_24160 [Prosthecomicrobium hirschii]